MSHYIVKTAHAKMPSSCWGSYRRVAVLEVEDGIEDVSRIWEHTRGVIRIVRTWERCHYGKTSRCAYAVALREADAMADELNTGAACSSPHQRNEPMTRSYIALRLAGRCLNGAERDGGRLFHAVEKFDRGHAERALCGATYGRQSAGWAQHEGAEVTCRRCLKRM